MFTRKAAANAQQELFDTADTQLTTPISYSDGPLVNLDLCDDHPDGALDQADSQLGRNQLISRIIQANKTATEDYLESFSDDLLSHYLAHLDTLNAPRGSAWNRPGDTPAIIEYETCF